jgi:outer membrane murein-binding lipoprotein Lpp
MQREHSIQGWWTPRAKAAGVLLSLTVVVGGCAMSSGQQDTLEGAGLGAAGGAALGAIGGAIVGNPGAGAAIGAIAGGVLGAGGGYVYNQHQQQANQQAAQTAQLQAQVAQQQAEINQLRQQQR